MKEVDKVPGTDIGHIVEESRFRFPTPFLGCDPGRTWERVVCGVPGPEQGRTQRPYLDRRRDSWSRTCPDENDKDFLAKRVNDCDRMDGVRRRETATL